MFKRRRPLSESQQLHAVTVLEQMRAQKRLPVSPKDISY